MSTAVAEPNEYKYIRAYGELAGWSWYDVDTLVDKAVNDNAPADAVYYNKLVGQWATIDILPAVTRHFVTTLAGDDD